MEPDKATRMFIAISQMLDIVEDTHTYKEEAFSRVCEKTRKLYDSLGYHELKQWLEKGGKK